MDPHPHHARVSTPDEHFPTPETQKNIHSANTRSPLGWLADPVTAAEQGGGGGKGGGRHMERWDSSKEYSQPHSARGRSGVTAQL